MDRITRVDQVLLLLKKQLAARSDAGRAAGSQASKAEARSAPSVSGTLDQALVQRLDSLRGSGLSNRGRLARVLVEELLMSQLGPEMLNDAQFQKAVDDVQQAFTADEELSELIDRLLEQ